LIGFKHGGEQPTSLMTAPIMPTRQPEGEDCRGLQGISRTVMRTSMRLGERRIRRLQQASADQPTGCRRTRAFLRRNLQWLDRLPRPSAG
jgi:hypothetical protein